MKILITGINGGLGINTAIQLHEKGYDIIGYGHSNNLTHPIINNIDFVEGDLLEKDKLKKVISKVKVIFHFGALTEFNKTMNDYINSNILGTVNIVDILMKERYPIEKIIFASSSAVYGEGAYECKKHGPLYPNTRNNNNLEKGNWNFECRYCNKVIKPIPTNENKEQYGNHIYAITKQTCEKILNSFSLINGITVINLRYSVLYGNYNSKGIIPLFLNKISSGDVININEDGNQIRDFIFLSDAAKMSIMVMENLLNNGTFNISSNTPISLLSLIKIISKLINKSPNINVTQNYRPGDVRHIYLNNNKFNKVFNYYPEIDLITGILQMNDINCK